MKRGINLLKLVYIFSAVILSIALICAYTQSKNVEINALERVYWHLDNQWILARNIAIFVGFILNISTISLLQKNIGFREIKVGCISALLGLTSGLIVFYGHSCCDTPVAINFGFPMSWAIGITNEDHYLSSPVATYLWNNFWSIHWEIPFFNFLLDSVFWFCMGVSIFLIFQRIKKVTAQANGQHIAPLPEQLQKP
jgi:hypothetical protein